jgi:hypothetical protein
LVPALLVGGFVLMAASLLRVIVRDIRWARRLRQHVIDELTQLKSLLSQRHLILSHLIDRIPNRLCDVVDRKTLESRLERARTVLSTLDPIDPKLADLRTLSDSEQRLFELVNDMLDTLNSTQAEQPSDALSACLDGLEKSTHQVLTSMATYNSAAITFRSFVQASAIARRCIQGGYEILDLEPPDSGVSSNSGAAIDQVIT